MSLRGDLKRRIYNDQLRKFLREREIALKAIRQKQIQAARKVAEVQEEVRRSNETLMVRARSIALRGPVNQRIDSGLIQLQKIVQNMRDALMARDTAEIMNLYPDINSEIQAESRNIMKSKFFKAIMRQLKKEERERA